MSHPFETSYAAALHTLFDHLADLEALRDETAREAQDKTLPEEEIVRARIQFEQLGIAVPAVRESIKRVMRNDTARREPGMRPAQRAGVVNHHFEVSLAAARARRAPVKEEVNV
jgi:hypothetical protein